MHISTTVRQVIKVLMSHQKVFPVTVMYASGMDGAVAQDYHKRPVRLPDVSLFVLHMQIKGTLGP